MLKYVNIEPSSPLILLHNELVKNHHRLSL